MASDIYQHEDNAIQMPPARTRIPPEIGLQITRLLPARSLSLSRLARWRLPFHTREQNAISHDRVWGSIFKPDLEPEVVCNAIGAAQYAASRSQFRDAANDLGISDLVLIGSDVQYLYHAKKSSRPLHLLLSTVCCKHKSARLLEIGISELENLSVFRAYTYTHHGTNVTSIHLTEFNIVLHLSDIACSDLLRLGVHSSLALSYHGCIALREVKLRYTDTQVSNSAGDFVLGYFCEIPFLEFSKSAWLRFTALPPSNGEIDVFVGVVLEKLLRRSHKKRLSGFRAT